MVKLFDRKAYMLQYRKDNKEKLSKEDKQRIQERRLKNKFKAIEYLGGKCNHCGIVSEYRGIYDFHHIDKTKKEADPGSLMNYSWKRIQKELDKCILLCANCHRIEHEKDNDV